MRCSPTIGARLTGLLGLLACAGSPKEPPEEGRTTPRLRWVRAYEGDSWEGAVSGLSWQLSLLGAIPPADGGAISVLSADEDRVVLTLDTEALGLGEGARQRLDEVLDGLNQSDEARIFGAVDLGRMLLGTLYDPWIYYTMTGACPTLEAWEKVHLPEDPARFAVNDSLLVPGEREIRLPLDPDSADAVAFLASEGEGSLSDGSFLALEHETLDLMSNGQQRFAVYDGGGEIIPAAAETAAGQPGRCMWCHEGDIQVISAGNEAVEGYLDLASFQAQLDRAQALLDQRRQRVASAVDWSDAEAHARGELLVETFLAPSPERLAREWGLDAASLEALIGPLSLSSAINEEYPEQGPLLSRAELDDALPGLLEGLAALSADELDASGGYQPIPTLSSAREPGAEELAGLESADLAATLDCSAGYQ